MFKLIYISLLFFSFGFNPIQKKTGWIELKKEDAAKMLQEQSKWYASTPSYSCIITHATYEGYEAIKPYEQKSGYVKKFKNGFHSYMMDIHTIQNKNYMITIDSVRKRILVNYPSKSFENIQFRSPPSPVPKPPNPGPCAAIAA